MSAFLRDLAAVLAALLGIAGFIVALWRYVARPLAHSISYEWRLRAAALRVVIQAFPRSGPTIFERVHRLELEMIRIAHQAALEEDAERAKR